MDSMPGKQPSVNRIACMYNPAGHTCDQRLNDLTLTKTKDLLLERSTYLRTNPHFVQHQMSRYPANHRSHYFGQRKAQTGWMEAIRHILQTDEIGMILCYKRSASLNPGGPGHCRRQAKRSILSRWLFDPGI